MGRSNYRIEQFIILEYAHQCSEAHRAHEFLFLTDRLEQIYSTAVLECGCDTKMCVFSGTGDPEHRLCPERDLQIVHPEHIADDIPDLTLVISSLHRRRIFPVYLKLLHDVVERAGITHLGLDTADLFVPHLHAESVVIEYFESLLHGSPDRPRNTFPVLLLEFLSNGKLIAVCSVVRCLDPELQLSSIGEPEMVDLIHPVDAVDMVEHIRVFPQNGIKLTQESGNCLLQIGPRSDHRISVMPQE